MNLDFIKQKISRKLSSIDKYNCKKYIGEVFWMFYFLPIIITLIVAFILLILHYDWYFLIPIVLIAGYSIQNLLFFMKYGKRKKNFHAGSEQMNLKKLNPIYWCKKINDSFVKIENMGMEGILELAHDISNEDNIIHCKYCGSLLNILKMPILIKSVKIGETYKIKCGHCKKENIITKSNKNW